MKQEDWESVARIYEQGIEKGKSTFNTVCPKYSDWDKNHIKECRYVFEDDGKVVGWIAISHTSLIKAYWGAVEVSLYVDDAFQNNGIGTSLLKLLCDESEKEGYWTLYSSIFADNFASIAVHKKCGFREIGYREKIARDRFGKWRNTIIMERRNNIL